MKDKLFKYLGVEPNRVGHTEKLASALGSFLGIYLVFYTSAFYLHEPASFIIVASMGASAVLLFAVPHGRLSQPWSLIGGHIISAIIGVTCAKYIPDTFIAASVAVSLAVGAMYYLRCIHPPGGATALSAVVGGSSVHELGYQFVLTPVLINVAALISVAIVFNYFFKWRRYPAFLAQSKTSENEKPEYSYDAIAHEDFVFALSEFDSFVDVSENDLLKIYNLVTHRHKNTGLDYKTLKHGHYYSNGEYENLWSVRQIVDWSIKNDGGEEELIYKVTAGAGRRSSGVMTKNAFSRWAKHEVIRDEDNWRRVDQDS